MTFVKTLCNWTKAKTVAPIVMVLIKIKLGPKGWISGFPRFFKKITYFSLHKSVTEIQRIQQTPDRR